MELIAFAPFAAFAAAIKASTPFAAAETVVAGRTFLARAGDIDGDFAALKILVVKLLDGFLSFLSAGKFDERKAAGTAAHLVEHEVDGSDGPGLGEVILQIVFARLEGQVPYE